MNQRLWQAVAEAGRCLFCHDAPCVQGCPAGVNVPVFIKKIRTGNFRGAARVIREANVLGGICARVCPTEETCEKACTSRLLDRPIPIGMLQQVACDEAPAGITLPGPRTRSDRRAAVVGAGPAGLAAAHELRLHGWEVIVYEAGDRAGGQLGLTIPPYRLPRQVVEAEVGAILSAGVEIRRGVKVGVDLPPELLLSENDAVILATGLGGSRSPAIPGRELAGVIGAEAFLASARRGDFGDLDPTGRRVMVVGGGNTAMDAAATAARAGAGRVTVAYRRTSVEMPAWRREYWTALADGVEFLWLVQPVAFEARDGWVGRTRLVRMSLGQADASGRAAPVPVAGSEYALDTDLVILALGQGPNEEIINAFGLAAEGGRPVADAAGRTSRDRVYVAGDLANGGATVVQAVAEGKRVGRSVAG